jgi:uridine phosphorylase
MYRVTDDVSVIGDFGIGSAITAALVEEKAALGVESFCILGGAGCLDTEIPPDEAILPTRAIRDEGASYHYLPPEQPVKPISSLVNALTEIITDSNIPVNKGPTWTIDAFYRETVPEIEQYANEGVLTAEMEAATLFAVADYHDLDAAAVLSVGDYITPDERDVPPAGHSLLPELFDPTMDALQAHVSK